MQTGPSDLSQHILAQIDFIKDSEGGGGGCSSNRLSRPCVTCYMLIELFMVFRIKGIILLS